MHEKAFGGIICEVEGVHGDDLVLEHREQEGQGWSYEEKSFFRGT